jgi:GTPase
LRLCIVGKPNAGKSSFVNKLLGEDRHLVSDIAGTTVDAIDSFLEHAGHRFRLIDTAGIRRKRSIHDRYESHAVVGALRGMDRCDMVLLLIDGTLGLTEQDKRIAAFADDKGCALIIVVNKWDLARKDDLDADTYAKQIRQSMPFLEHAPIRFVSAKTGKRVFDVLETAAQLAKQHFRRVSTSSANRVLKACVDGHQPTMHKGHRTRLLFASQIRVGPPTFVIATNDPDGVHFSYRRYVSNQFREQLEFGGAPLRFLYRKRDGESRRRKPQRDD